MFQTKTLRATFLKTHVTRKVQPNIRTRLQRGLKNGPTRLLPGRADYDDIAATKVQVIVVATSGPNHRSNCTACRYD
jgi:hypothetical protein